MHVLTILTDQHIFRFQVSVYDFLRVEVGKSQGDLSGKEFGCGLLKFSNFDKMTEELSTCHKSHQEIYSELVLEDEFHVYEEWVINCV